jgi:ribonuclease-3
VPIGGHDDLGESMLRASEHFLNDVFVFQNIESSQQLGDIFWKLQNLQQLLDNYALSFKDHQLIFKAFCHKSFAHECKVDIPNNERLEFLGDSVLQLIVSEKLMQRYPDKKEGQLSKLRSSIVNTDSLSALAQMLKLDGLILLGKGEFQEQGFSKESLLADSFEAFLGAVYQQYDLQKARVVLEQMLQEYEKQTGKDLFHDQVLNVFDAKSRLQEVVMKEFKVNPVYEASEFKDKKKTMFKVSLIVKDTIIKTITHESKKKAMQILAKDVLEQKLYQLKGN